MMMVGMTVAMTPELPMPMPTMTPAARTPMGATMPMQMMTPAVRISMQMAAEMPMPTMTVTVTMMPMPMEVETQMAALTVALNAPRLPVLRVSMTVKVAAYPAIPTPHGSAMVNVMMAAEVLLSPVQTSSGTMETAKSLQTMTQMPMPMPTPTPTVTAGATLTEERSHAVMYPT
jgi:hypothetical protein